MIHFNNKLFFIAVLPLFLYGCASNVKHIANDIPNAAVTTPNVTTEERPTAADSAKEVVGDNVPVNSSASKISSWELSGAMAARNKNKAWSASVNWLQKGASHYQIRLFGPLGGGTVLIERQGGAVSFRDGPKSATSSNADQLLLQQTGVQLPVNNLYYWVRGIAAPGQVQGMEKDSDNRITNLRQGGYVINYLSYTNVNNNPLPTNIRLQGQGVSIKLIIKRWKI